MEFVEGGVWSFADVLQIKHEGIAIVAGTSRGDGNVIFQSELNG